MKLKKCLFFALILSAYLLSSNVVPAAENDDISLFFDDSEMAEAPSRYPKTLSQVTEQVTIFTAEDIERSHVHTIGQFLAKVPGLFVEFSSPDIGQVANFNSLGSRNYHTLILVDGVRQNNGSVGSAFINGLHPSIIKK
nr:Plug domain-containing protein [Desulfobulbaceae bacterium]